MENEKEIKKLVNVLRQIKRTPRFAAWFGEDPETSEYCVRQYNKIVTRLGELEPAVQTLFTPLPEQAAAKTLHFAVRELVAYLTDEEEEGKRPGHRHHDGWGCGRKRRIFDFGPGFEQF
jgi:hypothetical protein